MRTLVRLNILLTLALCLLSLAAVRNGYAQKTGLSHAQVERLIKLHAPDNLVASQIRSRGASFAVSPKIVDELKSEGAGPETVAALRDQIQVGAIQIQAEPGSQLSLDEMAVGTASADGTLNLQNVQTGAHTLTASKEGFGDSSIQFSLAKNENKRVLIPLHWLGGYLTITAKPDGAKVAVSGPKSMQGGALEVQCPPGSYTATVSEDGYISQTRSFEIKAGEHYKEDIVLAADPAVLAQKLSDARSKLSPETPARRRNSQTKS